MHDEEIGATVDGGGHSVPKAEDVLDADEAPCGLLDLIGSDLDMPGIPGIEFLNVVREGLACGGPKFCRRLGSTNETVALSRSHRNVGTALHGCLRHDSKFGDRRHGQTTAKNLQLRRA